MVVEVFTGQISLLPALASLLFPPTPVATPKRTKGETIQKSMLSLTSTLHVTNDQISLACAISQVNLSHRGATARGQIEYMLGDADCIVPS